MKLDQARTVTAAFNLGASFVVTNLNDNGPGSLRQVIADANVVPGANLITFQPDLTGIITLTTGEIAISDDATIEGLGATVLAVSGNNASRIFTVAAGKTVAVDQLKLQNGFSSEPGGAILNNGNLTISKSDLSNNQSTLTGSFNGGGAIANADTGVLTVIDSSLSGNTGVTGGAINNQIGGATTIRNSTLSGNTGNGGGIFSRGTLTIETSTLSGNVSTSDGGGIHAWDGATTVMDSTIASNTAASGGGGIAKGAGALMVLSSTLSATPPTAAAAGMAAVACLIWAARCSSSIAQCRATGRRPTPAAGWTTTAR
ncbi:MAG: hypothetical protein HC889_20075 [Synechococcaceae cyanobacterium SM1_2_3]|nr:hypothetical protein [Synechococcaceae cyanobacterium SM1_2_3]